MTTSEFGPSSLFTIGKAALRAALTFALPGRRHRAAEPRMEDQARRYRAVMRAAGDGIHILDRDGRLVEASDSFYRMLGHDPDRPPPLAVGDWDAGLAGDDLPAKLAALFAGEPETFETRHRRADGTLIDVEVTAFAFESEGGALLYNSARDVTARKAAQARLDDSEDRFRSLVESTTDWVWETDADHCLSWLSTSVGMLIPPETLIGRRRWDVAVPDPDSGEFWQRHMEDLARHRPFRDFRYWILDARGRRRWVSVSGSPRFGENGHFLGYRGSGTDITERAADATRLRLFSKTVEQLPLTVVISDTGGRIQYVNPFVETLTGFDAAELVGQHVSALGSGGATSDGATSDEALWESLRTGATWTGEFCNRRKDGSLYWLAATVFPVTDGEGVTTHYVAVGQDVTERNRDVLALAQAHSLLNAVLDNTPMGIAIIGVDRVIRRVNRAFSSMFGLSRDEAEGQSVRLLFASDEDFETVGREILATLLAGEVYTGVRHFVHQPDGRAVMISVAGKLIDPANPAMGVVWTGEDVTERLAAEAQLAETNAKLLRVNQELEQFAYVASHDLRQPLRMVASYVTLIEKRLGAEIDEDMRAYVAYARGGAKRMGALIQGLLQYSRTGRTKDNWEDVALDKAVADAVHGLEVAVGEAEAEVAVAPGLPQVAGDMMELSRLFQNLIGNAIKFRAPDRPPRVAVTWADGGDEWRVAVADNGIGIAPEHWERAFGIFQRLVADEAYEGTGIGLAVCKKIAEHHGGRIWIDSTPGEGSTFTVGIPKTAERD